MTSSRQLENLVVDKVLQHADLAVYTPNIILHEVTETAESELSPLMLRQRINFFQLLVNRTETEKGLNRRELVFTAALAYFLERDAKGENFRVVRDALEKVQDLVVKYVSADDSGLLDYVEMNQQAGGLPTARGGVTNISSGTVGGVSCYLASFAFKAVKSVALE